MTAAQHPTTRTVLRVLAQGCLVIGMTLALSPLALWLVPLLDPTSAARTTAATNTPTDSPLALSATGVLIAGIGLLLSRRWAAKVSR